MLVTLAAGTLVHRFYNAAFDPIYFDQAQGGRLNSPDGSYGVLYVAERIEGAFAETFLRSPGNTLLARDFLSRKAYVRLRLATDLVLVQLHGTGLARLGATAEVTHGPLPYDNAQAWSAALHGHPSGVDGIAYRARHNDDEICYALFGDRRVTVVEDHRDTELDADWFWTIAEPVGVSLAPDA